jgi:hypothetical protein
MREKLGHSLLDGSDDGLADSTGHKYIDLPRKAKPRLSFRGGMPQLKWTTPTYLCPQRLRRHP